MGGKTNDKSSWKKVKEKFEKRLGVWENKFLSLGGRIVLTNAVLNALSMYYFSFFKAPQSILKELKGIQRNFIWGGNIDKEKKKERKIALVKWERVCEVKEEEGGLGVKDLKSFNLALLGRWVWRLLEGRNEL